MPIFRNTLFLTVLLALPLLSNAQVLINEIMYDSPGADDDWIEIYNSGGAPVTIVPGSSNGSWRFVDSGSHVLTLVNGNNTLGPQEFAIITNDPAKFQTDWPGFSGALFKSSFSVTNTSATLSIKDGSGNITDQISYSSDQGAKGDGNSLQRNGSSWITALPTPGLVNSSTSHIPDEISTTTSSLSDNRTDQSSDQEQNSTNSSNTRPSSHYGSVILTDPKSKINFIVGAGRSRLSAVGTPMEFKADANTDYTRSVTFKWSFGDGGTAEGQTVHHVYSFPGEYVVMLNASAQGTGEAASRAIVKVISADLFVSAIFANGIEISNNFKDEINLYGRALVSGDGIFIFPKDTIIMSGQKIVFDNSITGLKPRSKDDVSIEVIGDEVENFGTLSRATKENIIKASKIKTLESKIADLNKKIDAARGLRPISNLASVPTYLKGDEKSMQTINTASVAIAVSSTSTSTPQRTWMMTIKHFFRLR